MSSDTGTLSYWWGRVHCSINAVGRIDEMLDEIKAVMCSSSVRFNGFEVPNIQVTDTVESIYDSRNIQFLFNHGIR